MTEEQKPYTTIFQACLECLWIEIVHYKSKQIAIVEGQKRLFLFFKVPGKVRMIEFSDLSTMIRAFEIAREEGANLDDR